MKGRRSGPAVFDVAIVGAGIAGTYIAWRFATAPPPNLSTQEQPLRIGLFESTGKEGGRLLTAQMPGMPFWAELGAMRYTKNQILLSRLINRLGIASSQFEFNVQFRFLRGYHLKYGKRSKRPYQLGKIHEPHLLVKEAFRKALLDLEFSSIFQKTELIEGIRTKLKMLDAPTNRELTISLLSAREWEIVKRYGLLAGQPLSSIGLWNLLHFYLSSDGFSSEEFFFARDAFGYQSILANWNAAEAIPWFLSDFDVEYLKIDRMDHLVDSLGFEIKKSWPNSVYLEHTVESISPCERNGEELLALSFKEGQRRVLAKHVILAIPKNALSNISFIDFPKIEYDRFGLALESVTAHPLFKLFLGFERAWWTDLNIISGRAVTDLPIRQVYYFGPDKAFEQTTKGMLMASYSDAYFVDFWRPLHRRLIPLRNADTASDKGSEETYFYKGSTPPTLKEKALLDLHGATERMVRKAHRQIQALHSKICDPNSIPEPYVALEKEWIEGWHTWNVHYNSWEVMKILQRPFSANVYVCGEAFSCEQGWIEGALRSAEMVLAELGGSPPDWVPTVAYKDVGYSGYYEYLGKWADL